MNPFDGGTVKRGRLRSTSDVRGGSIKRVAYAVGEGSIAISLVHKVLQE
ncbi:MAG TPA: hypothetical protein VFS97_14710 [Nitrososphaeraceae archaeon]|nr:hypothetical protein [Nitrososphaeraceae archaeon]